ncbi:MAG: hypothetical protein ACK5F2_00530 [Roseateles sp.]|jgi:hypothetical protein
MTMKRPLLPLLLAAPLGLTATAALALDVPEPQVKQIVLEDDHTRVEELRVRGQTQKVTVQPKNSKAPAYEIIMGDGSRDLSAGPGSTRGAAGQRVWRLLDF